MTSLERDDLTGVESGSDQHAQPIEGTWFSDDFYGSHGRELQELRIMPEGHVEVFKITGDPNVPSGKVTWQTNGPLQSGFGPVAGKLTIRSNIHDPNGFEFRDMTVECLAPNHIEVIWQGHAGQFYVLGEERILLQKRAVAIGKAVAGLVRLTCEDLYSGGCQCIYLAKEWHNISNLAKAFTIASVSAGILCSISGPIVEYTAFKTMARPKAKDAYGNYELPDGDALEQIRQSAETKLRNSQNRGVDAAPLLEPVAARKPEFKIPNVSIGTFLTNEVFQTDGRFAHRVLLFSLCVYWIAMATSPFIFDLKCGAAIPASAVYMWFSVASLVSLAEIWVLVQCRNGYMLFKTLNWKLLVGWGLGMLARFDTLGDVINAKIISDCDPITWFSIYGYVFHLPTKLSTMVLFGVIVGVFMLQTLPGLGLLACKKHFPVSFKLNDLCLLLVAMEDEIRSKAT